MKTRPNHRNWRWWVLLGALVLVGFLVPDQAQAATKRWVGGSGWWDVDTNWTPPGQPMAGDWVNLRQDDALNRTVRYRNRDYPGAVLEYLDINASGTGTMTLYLGRDSLDVNYEYIAVGDELGSPATGNVLQKRGTHTVGTLFLGVNPGCTGTYELKGGDLEELDTGYLGYFGNATFTQTGGTHTTYMLYLGYQADSVGTYNLRGGRLGLEIPSWPLWNQERIGYYGTGTLNQTGGTHNAIGVILGSKTGGRGTYNQSGGSHTTNILYLGEETGSTGVYNLRGGSLEVISASPLLSYVAEKIGVQGDGSFTQTGGSHYVNGNLVLGEAAGSKGSYMLSGGSLAEILGPQIGWLGRGTFIQTGGGHQIRDRFFLGCLSGSEGTYELHGGTLSAAFEDIGVAGQGVFTQTGGSNQVIYSAYLSSGELLIGDFAAGVGTYNLYGGSLSNYATTIGLEGTGTFIQTAGTHTIDQQLILGSWAGSTGRYELRGGSLSVGDDTTVGEAGTGTFIQTAGTHTIADMLIVGNRGPGSYELRGGSLSNDATNVGNDVTGTFIQTAGTHTIGRELILGGRSASSLGTYELGGGSLSDDNTTVGKAGTGSFIQTAGTHTIDQQLILAFGASSLGTYELRGGNLSNDNTTVGEAGTGTFIQTAGTHTIHRHLILANDSGSTGTYELRGGSLFSDMTTVGNAGIGSFTQTWGSNQVTTQLTLGASSVIPFNLGTYDLLGGDLSAGRMQVNLRGIFNQEGGTLGCGDLENLGSITLRGGITEVHGTFLNHSPGMVEIFNSPIFHGDATNLGTIKVTGTTVTWAGTFINSGTYTSDPATQTFNNLIVEAGGVLVGGQGDYFLIKEDFINLSTANQAWNTREATLRFIRGTDKRHTLYLPGLDLGAATAGYLQNFAWGCLDLTGQQLWLSDSDQTPGGALYVGEILGLKWDEDLLTNVFGNGLNIYYDPFLPGNQYLEHLTFNLKGGGYLMPLGFNLNDGEYLKSTPLPPSAWLLLSGLVGLGLWRKAGKLYKG